MAREIKDENIVVGKMLQQARESRKVLQSELCDACGLTKNHISAVERGVSQASIKMLLGYCKKLDMSPNDIEKNKQIHPKTYLLNLMVSPKFNVILRCQDAEYLLS